MGIKFSFAFFILCLSHAAAYGPGDSGLAVTELSLYDMLNLKVTSVSKKAERLQDAAASVYVITEEDIQRSGAIRIQDVLNLVPGVWFIENSYTAPSWSVREDPTSLSQSVNVLLDGVPLATDVYGCVHYDGLEIPLAEIERIEVIRGPGGTIYGANSSTGIITISTKRPDEFQGGYARVSGGTQDYVSPVVRYGRSLNDKTAFSSYVMIKHHSGYDKNPDFIGDVVTVTDTLGKKTAVVNRFAGDEPGTRDALALGLNVHMKPTRKSRFTSILSFRGNEGREYAGVSFPYPPTIGPQPPDSLWVADIWNGSACINSRFDYAFRENHNAFMRVYYTVNDNNFAYYRLGTARFKSHVVNAEVLDNVNLFTDKPVRLELNYGANFGGVFVNSAEYSQTSRIRFVNKTDTSYVAAGFVQYKLSLGEYADITSGIQAEIRSIIGTKPEFSPRSVRLSVKPNRRLTLWGAISRNVTTPGYFQTRVESRMFAIPPAWAFTLPVSQGGLGMHPDSVPAGAGKWVAVICTSSIKPAQYRTLELGLRSPVTSRTSLEASAYATFVNDKIYVMPADTTFRTVCVSKVYGDTIVPMYYANIHTGKIFGFEAVAKTGISDFGRLELSYTWLRTDMEMQTPGGTKSVTTSAATSPGPEHVIRTRLYIDLPWNAKITLNALGHSAFTAIQGFNYITQKPDERNGQFVLGTKPRLRLDCSVEKALFGNKVTLYGWGKNILYKGYIESFDKMFTPYPHIVNRTFGGGVSYAF